MNLQQCFQAQRFANGYALVNGVEMHVANPESFQIPHQVLKKYVRAGHFIELRIDSPRFSTHEDAVEKCYCASCRGEATKPILGHEQPASLWPLPKQHVPSRGWGEEQGDFVYFHEDHILTVHGSHRKDLVHRMDIAELKTLANWLGSQRN